MRYDGLLIELTFKGKEDYYRRSSHEHVKYISENELYHLMEEVSKVVHKYIARDRTRDIELSQGMSHRLIDRKKDNDSERMSSNNDDPEC
jgi:hypothetical protein